MMATPPTGWRWWVWAIFGNDEAGIYGPSNPHTALGAIKWWFRNPIHNLCWHVWQKEGGWFFELPKDGRFKPGWWCYLGHRPWTTPPGAFGIKLTYEKNKV